MISVLWVRQVLAPSFQRLYFDHKSKQTLKVQESSLNLNHTDVLSLGAQNDS